MRKLMTLIFATILSLGLMSSVANAGVEKGQKLIIKKLKKACGFNGGVLAKKHTQEEWKKIQDEGKLAEEIKLLCPKSKPLKKKYLTHIYDFLHNYASDSGNVPS